jgi:hypothetical protein
MLGNRTRGTAQNERADKKHVFSAFFWPAPCLVLIRKSDPNFIFFASCTQEKLRISVARRDDEKRAPKQNGAAQSLSKNETPNPGPNPTHFRQFVRKNQRRQCRNEGFSDETRVRVTPNVFIEDY